MGCLSSTLRLCPYHSSMHTVLELLLSLSVSGTDCEAAEGRHTYLICHYSPASSSAWREAEAH